MRGRDIAEVDPATARAVENELERQQTHGLEMIASENFAPRAVLQAQGSVMTNKYAEGYPGRRYYAGCEHYDTVERLARERAEKLFGADHANVQPHSGSQANFSAYFALLEAGDTVLGPQLSHGGHLTHGHFVNFSGDLFDVERYGVDEGSERFEPEDIIQRAEEVDPDMIVCGFSAYPRQVPFEAFREAADATDAYLMADIAHIAGLVAADEHPSPFPQADVVTTSTHKTLRGARGGLILSKEEHADAVDKHVFPYAQGGPLMHQVAGKAVSFKLGLEDSFEDYQRKVRLNAQVLAEELQGCGFRLVTGGTDTHLVLVDVTSKGMTGREAEQRLEEAGIVVNKNTIPYDDKPPRVTSGIRIGAPALTTRGMEEQEFREIAGLIDRALAGEADAVADRVETLCDDFPLYEDMEPY